MILQKPNMQSMVNWEVKVRQGQATDALNDLRTGLIASETLKLSKLDMSGKRPSLRMGKKIHRKNHEVEAAADEYRYAWAALYALGMAADEAEGEENADTTAGGRKRKSKGRGDTTPQGDGQAKSSSNVWEPASTRGYRRLRKSDAVPSGSGVAQCSRGREKKCDCWVKSREGQ